VNVANTKRLLTTMLPALALAAIPVLAVQTGFSPLNTAVETIASLFNVTALQNERVAEGFAYFTWFVITFSLYNYGGLKLFKDSKRTANTIAFFLALISTFFMPVQVLMTASKVYASIFWIFIFTLPPLLALYFGYRTKENNHLGQRLMDLVIVSIGALYSGAVVGSLAKYVADNYQNIGGFVDTVATYMYIIMLLAAIWKFIALFGGGAGGERAAGGIMDGMSRIFSGGGGGQGWRPSRRPPASPRERKPTRPIGLEGALLPEQPVGAAAVHTDRLALWWTANPLSEGVTHYEMRVRGTRGGHHPVGTQTVAPTESAPHYITLSTVSGLSWAGDSIIRVSIRAINGRGRSGWRYETIVQPSDAGRHVDFTTLDNEITRLTALRGLLEHTEARVRAHFIAITPISPATLTAFENFLYQAEIHEFEAIRIIYAIQGDAHFTDSAGDVAELISKANTLRALVGQIAYLEGEIHRMIP